MAAESPWHCGHVLRCEIVPSEFELLLSYYVQLQTKIHSKYMKPLVPARVMNLIVPLLLFYKDRFDIKLHMMFDMPLEKRNQTEEKNCT